MTIICSLKNVKIFAKVCQQLRVVDFYDKLVLVSR